MIESIRVDDRLIHGQVALVWSKEYGVTHIVVANDAASVNDVQQMTLKMATPSGIKLLIKNVADAIGVFNHPKAQETKMFVLTNTITDALRIVEACDTVKSVNVANVGRFDRSENKVTLNSCLLVNPEEMNSLRKLAEKDIPVFHQVIPSAAKVSVSKLI